MRLSQGSSDVIVSATNSTFLYTISALRVYFTPNRAISGLAVVGLPGTEGRLKVVSESQILGDNLVLLIPFKLAQCPLGYYDPPGASTHEEVSGGHSSTGWLFIVL